MILFPYESKNEKKNIITNMHVGSLHIMILRSGELIFKLQLNVLLFLPNIQGNITLTLKCESIYHFDSPEV